MSREENGIGEETGEETVGGLREVQYRGEERRLVLQRDQRDCRSNATAVSVRT